MLLSIVVIHSFWGRVWLYHNSFIYLFILLSTDDWIVVGVLLLQTGRLWVFLCVSSNALPNAGWGSTALASPGNMLEMQNLRLRPDSLNENLPLYKIPGWLPRTLKFEKPWLSMHVHGCLRAHVSAVGLRGHSGVSQAHPPPPQPIEELPWSASSLTLSVVRLSCFCQLNGCAGTSHHSLDSHFPDD